MWFFTTFFTWLVGVFWYQHLHVIPNLARNPFQLRRRTAETQLPMKFAGPFAGRCYKRRQWILGGGFKYFLCSSLLGEMIQFDWYFSNGLKPPTRIVLEDLKTPLLVILVYLLELWYLLIFTSWRRSWKTLCCAGVGKLNLTDAVMLMTFHCVQRSNCYPKLMNSLWEYLFCSFSTILPHHHLICLRSIFSLQLPEVLGVSRFSSAWKLIEVWTSTASVSWGWRGISFELCQCRYVNCIFVNPKKKEIMESKLKWSSKWSNDCFIFAMKFWQFWRKGWCLFLPWVSKSYFVAKGFIFVAEDGVNHDL